MTCAMSNEHTIIVMSNSAFSFSSPLFPLLTFRSNAVIAYAGRRAAFAGNASQEMRHVVAVTWMMRDTFMVKR